MRQAGIWKLGEHLSANHRVAGVLFSGISAHYTATEAMTQCLLSTSTELQEECLQIRGILQEHQHSMYMLRVSVSLNMNRVGYKLSHTHEVSAPHQFSQEDRRISSEPSFPPVHSCFHGMCENLAPHL